MAIGVDYTVDYGVDYIYTVDSSRRRKGDR
jgi:hypothetical protein